MGLKSDLLFTLSGKLDGSLGGAFGQFEQKAGSATNKAEAGVKRVNKEISKTGEAFRGAAAAAGVFEGTFGGITSRLNASANLITNAGLKIGLAVGGIATGAALLSAASGIQNYQARLVSATAGQKEFVAAQELTRRLAKDTRSDLGDTIQFYVRLTAATKQLGLEQRQIESIMSTVQKSIQLSGATAQESTAAVQQFVQGLSSANGLSGDEFKSLGENAVKVLQTIAAGLEKTGGIPGFDGTIQSLRDLGSQGKLTAAVLVPALEAMKSSVDDSFTRMPVTIQQSTTLMKNALTELVIKTEDATGILQGSANTISFFANNLNLLGTAAVATAAFFASRVVPALAATAEAAIVTNAALLATTIQTRGLAAAAALLAGSIPIAGIALAAGAAYYFGTRASEAQQAADRLGVSYDELKAKAFGLTEGINSSNAALREQARLNNAKNLGEASDNATSARGKVQNSLAGAAAEALLSGDAASAYQIGALAGRYRELKVSAAGVVEEFGKIAAKNPSLKLAYQNTVEQANNSVLAATGYVLFKKKIQDAEAQATADILNKNQIGVPKTAANVASGTKASDLDAQARVEAIDGGTKALEAAARRRDLALKNLKSELVGKGGTVAPDKVDEYKSRTAAILQTYEAERNGIEASKRAAATSAAAARAAAAADKRDRREALADTNELQRIRDKYDKEPSRKDSVDKDLARLRELQAELGKKIIPDSLFADIEANMQRSLIKPLIDANIAAQESLDIQTLIAAGRDADAELLRRSLALIKQGVDASAINLTQIASQVEAERAVNREIERRNELIGIYARASGEFQSTLRNLIFDVQGGDFAKAFSNAGKSLFDSFRASVADEISVKFFGNAQQDATDQMTGALDVNTDALGNLAAVIANYQDAFQNGDGVLAGGSGLNAFASQIASAASSPLAANDNGFGRLGTGGTILTNAAPVLAPLTNSLKAFSSSIGTQQKGVKGFNTATERFNQIGADFGAKIDKGLGTEVFAKLGSKLGTALQGASYGQMSSGVAATLGIKQDSTGAALGGAAGGLIGGPIGAAIGGLIGGTLLQAIKKDPYADTRIKTGQFGDITSTTKNRGDASGATSAANSVISSLNNLASTFNATVKANANIGAIGTNKDKFYFDPTGGGFKSGSAQVVASAEEAVALALRNAINSGIIEGLRQGTKNLLAAAGTDLQAQAAKAQKFEGVFTSLKQILDPVGAAVDAVNKQFTELSSIFKEAGASAEEYAQLQQLYDLQRADAIKSAGSATTAALKDYLTQLTTGSSSGLSIRDREAQAKADFAPFVSDLAAGKKVDTDAYLKAAENLRTTDRELFGSTQGYFDTLAQITSLTKQAIGDSENVTSLSGALKFDTAPVTDGLSTLQGALAGIGNQQVALLNEIANLIAANSNTPSNSGGSRADLLKINNF